MLPRRNKKLFQQEYEQLTKKEWQSGFRGYLRRHYLQDTAPITLVGRQLLPKKIMNMR